MLLCEGCQGSKFTNAGIGDQHIDLSLSFHGLVESIEVLQFADVPANTCNVAADRLHGLIEFLLAAARYENIRAFVDEALRRGETYSRGASGNHSHLSLQLAHSSLLLLIKRVAAALTPRAARLSAALETS